MFGISDCGAFCLTVLVFLVLPGPGNVCFVELGRAGRL